MNKIERIQQIVDYEMQAISRTISEYSTNDFIASYAKQLLNIKFPSDNDKLTFLVTKLLEWYEEKLQVIKDNKYIHNKESHIKSYELLQELSQLVLEYDIA